MTTGYISSLNARPTPLTPSGRQPSRLAELWSALAWIFGSWRRPADAEAGWQQRLGREARLP